MTRLSFCSFGLVLGFWVRVTASFGEPLRLLVILGGEHHFYEENTRIVVEALSQHLDLTADFTRVDRPPEGLPRTEPSTIPANPAIFDASDFRERYDVILCYDHYAYNAIEEPTRQNYLDLVWEGVGWVGMHSASSTFRKDPEYIRMVGGVFVSHEPYRTMKIQRIVGEHSILDGIEDFEIEDEFYYIDQCDLEENHVLLVCRSPEDGAVRPVAWTRRYGKGKVFYTILGHSPDSCRSPDLQRLLARALQWAAP